MLKDSLQSFISEKSIDNAFIMMYFTDQVLLGKIQDSQLILPDLDFKDEYLMEIHIFNKEYEYRGKTIDALVKIEDSDDYFTEDMFLIGNESKIENGMTIVTQNGRRMVLPFEVTITNVKSNKMRLSVHHLFNDNGEICGYRLVDIKGF